MKDLLTRAYVGLEVRVGGMKRRIFRERKGAAVLETVLLIVAAVVIVGALLVFFVGKNGKGGVLTAIFNKIVKMLGIEVETPSVP